MSMEYDFNRVKDVPGWLTPQAANLLYDLATNAPLNRALEIGTFCGKSAIVIGDAMKERGGTLICCDIFGHNVPYVAGTISDLEASFLQNISDRELDQTIISFKMNHSQLAGCAKGKFGICYVDGAHYMERVLQDALFAWGCLVPGGYIVFDDYINATYPDVFKCVNILSKLWNVETIAKIEPLTIAFQKPMGD